MLLEIPETGVSVEFDEKAVEATKIRYNGEEEAIKYIKFLLGDELGSRGHFINPDQEYPGDFQKGLNQAFDLGIKVSGVIAPPAPVGAQD